LGQLQASVGFTVLLLVIREAARCCHTVLFLYPQGFALIFAVHTLRTHPWARAEALSILSGQFHVWLDCTQKTMVYHSLDVRDQPLTLCQ
jgi:hypothetical protein